MKKTKVVVESSRLAYNNHCPHSSLGFMTLVAFATECIAPTQFQQYIAQNIDKSWSYKKDGARKS
ncbi:MAG: hypothetical protein ABIG61_11450 [Planctomycetota bacterium]